MNNVDSVIIVGASAAGINCLRQLRSGGYQGQLILIDKDEHGAYERPPLSKQVLMDTQTSSEDFSLITVEEIAELQVEAYFADALVEFNPANKTLKLASGKQLTADAVVLATGGEARRLPIEGADLPNVFVLRHFADALKLREKLKPDVEIAVIGGGFIGAETSASLAKLGAKVYWLDAAKLPLAHLLPRALCEKIVQQHQDSGIELISNCQINAIVEAENGRSAIVLQEGKTIEVDAVVLGVGMSPNLSYLPQAFKEQMYCDMTGGIKVNQNFETPFAGVYAAGDVASISQANGKAVRHEHWQSAQHQGECVAASLLNQPTPAEPVHWFWSDQGDLHIEMAGKILPEHLVIREEADWPVVFSVVDKHVVGAASVNNPNAVRAAMRMIKNNVEVNVEQLVDPDIPLRKLMRG